MGVGVVPVLLVIKLRMVVTMVRASCWTADTTVGDGVEVVPGGGPQNSFPERSKWDCPEQHWSPVHRCWPLGVHRAVLLSDIAGEEGRLGAGVDGGVPQFSFFGAVP